MTRRSRCTLAVFGCATLAWVIVVFSAILRESWKVEYGEADAIIVLGAAVFGDRPSPVFEGRLEQALRLFREGRAKWIILTGGRSEEDAVSEALAGKQYLVARQVPPGSILIEEVSRTTMENLREAKALMAQVRARSAFVVSDPLHMLRSRVMWEALEISALGAPTRYSRYQGFFSRLKFAAREALFLHGYWVLKK